MWFFKTLLITTGVALCIKTVYSAAPEDESLQMLFESFLPNGFLEKPVASKSSDKQINTKADKAAQADTMVSGLINILDGLSSPDNGDCKFSCSNGAKPKHLAGYRPIPNGCGTHGFKADTSDLPGITDCCNRHDVCYGTCNSGQRNCDTEFQRCMLDACESMGKAGRFKTKQELTDCREVSSAFHLAAASVGCEFYRDAQRSACLCDLRAGGGETDSGERVRRYNQQKRATEDAYDPLESVDMSNPLFDLPGPLDHVEL